jgi:tRNA(fMet)-specific endonuclease VapC
VNRYLFDTDTFSLYLQHNPEIIGNMIRHLSDEVMVSIITVKEMWDGWAAVVAKAKTPDQVADAYSRLTNTLNELKNWPIVTFLSGAVAQYAALKKQRLNVGSNDLKIASIALVIGAKVVTKNRRDFARIPSIMIEDWTL